MRYLAIDHGQRRTGLALCDPGEIVVSPHAVLEGRDNTVSRVAAIVRDESVQAVVVGLPLNMDGSEGFQARRVREFAGQLAGAVDVPILFQDERLSSFAAEVKLADFKARGGKSRRPADALAAAAILEMFLESNPSGEGVDP